MRWTAPPSVPGIRSEALGRLAGGLIEAVREDRILGPLARYAYLRAPRPRPGPGDDDLSPPPGREGPRVAFICDEMTWRDFSPCCAAYFLHPGAWREQIDASPPDLLFCEAAWSGIERWEGCWRGRIYRDRTSPFEGRRELLAVLDVCRARGIPTVFWNKEDPLSFSDPRYDFVDTALRFDHVFTTAAECVPWYRERGRRRIGILPFGVDTDLFYPVPEEQRPGTALFAGSWSADLPGRCDALSRLLDYVIGSGLELDIYDRRSASPERRFRFPERYRPYIRPAVPFSQMPALARRYEWAVNVDTVTGSETMRSRRILQMAASGARVLCSPSLGAAGLPGSRPVDLGRYGPALEIHCDHEELRRDWSTRDLFRRVTAVLELRETAAV